MVTTHVMRMADDRWSEKFLFYVTINKRKRGLSRMCTGSKGAKGELRMPRSTEEMEEKDWLDRGP